ncbi:MAG: histone deacetylase [Fuerstiella sp.]
MTLLYTDNRFLNHDTGEHPECADRLRAIQARLQDSGLLKQVQQIVPTAVTEAHIKLVHSTKQVAAFDALAAKGGGRLDADTVVSDQSPTVARLAAGAAVDAVSRVLNGEDRQALCLIRPPGHHATASKAMGFCLLNNVSIAAKFAIAANNVNRILIVDWDVHHGNGTQDIFYDDSQVTFFSVHRHPFWPGSGLKTETGTADGLGHTVNLPLPFETSRQEYFAAVRSSLEALADKVRPELILISAGFDAHHLDPIGALKLETQDFQTLTEIVQQIAATHSNRRIVSLLEGGYNTEKLAECVETHLHTLINNDKPAGSAAQ